MTRADRVLSTPPLNTSSLPDANSPPNPLCESVDSLSHQPGIGQPESGNLTSDSPKPFEAIDLAQLRFVRCLVRYGATLDDAAAVVASELERARQSAEKDRRQALRRSQLSDVSAAKSWEAQGISQSTWYRRRQQARAIQNQLLAQVRA
jgi:hypothetical protein